MFAWCIYACSYICIKTEQQKGFRKPQNTQTLCVFRHLLNHFDQSCVQAEDGPQFSFIKLILFLSLPFATVLSEIDPLAKKGYMLSSVWPQASFFYVCLLAAETIPLSRTRFLALQWLQGCWKNSLYLANWNLMVISSHLNMSFSCFFSFYWQFTVCQANIHCSRSGRSHPLHLCWAA